MKKLFVCFVGDERGNDEYGVYHVGSLESCVSFMVKRLKGRKVISVLWEGGGKLEYDSIVMISYCNGVYGKWGKRIFEWFKLGKVIEKNWIWW